ncbi:MAG: hypothetical protein M1822_004434 [Bathelium mastoideum]|nr:MAG: hypothetical protein M1822_004434 [Bathelium mastoideum]
MGIAKTVAFFNLTTRLLRDHDVTYDDALVFYWAISESCLAVVGACFPTMRPMFRGWSPESIVNSVRSAISLRSFGSDRSRPSVYPRTQENTQSTAAITKRSEDGEHPTRKESAFENDAVQHVPETFEMPQNCLTMRDKGNGTLRKLREKQVLGVEEDL